MIFLPSNISQLTPRREGRIRLLRRLASRRWPAVVRGKAVARRMLIRERARGDTFATIDRNSIVGVGIRLSGGSLLVVPSVEVSSPRKAKLRKKRGSKLRYPFLHPRNGDGPLYVVVAPKRQRLIRTLR